MHCDKQLTKINGWLYKESYLPDSLGSINITNRYITKIRYVEFKTRSWRNVDIAFFTYLAANIGKKMVTLFDQFDLFD